jgi:hypothetical protein
MPTARGFNGSVGASGGRASTESFEIWFASAIRVRA